MPGFEILYFLENYDMYLIEVKRNGLPPDSNPSQKFKWLRIDKETLEIAELTFHSMDSAGELEERYFEQGFLKFNASTGTYIEKYNSAQHPLDNRKDFRIPTFLYNSIEAYLGGNPF